MVEILRQCATLIEGRDPSRIEACTRRLYEHGGWHYFRRLGNYAIAAIDMALWDLVDLAAGRSVPGSSAPLRRPDPSSTWCACHG